MQVLIKNICFGEYLHLPKWPFQKYARLARLANIRQHSPYSFARTRQTRGHSPNHFAWTRQTRRHSPSHFVRTHQTRKRRVWQAILRGLARLAKGEFGKCYANLANLASLANYGKIMRCALFEILYLTEVYLVTD